MSDNKITKVTSIVDKVKAPKIPLAANKDYFAALMQQRRVQTAPSETVTAKKEDSTTKLNTLFDEVRNLNRRANDVAAGGSSSPKDLVVQARDVIGQIDVLKNKLETPDLQLKSSIKTVLKNRLSHIDDNLKITLEKAGLEYRPPERTTSLAKPMDRFLGLLTHAQSQLDTLAGNVLNLSAASGGHLTPANTLLIQIKVTQIQQQIELFTSMLNKALESTKTIMNVQV